MFIKASLISAILPFLSALPAASAQASGSGTTTRFWDCCKPSCAWPGKASVSGPVGTCNAQNSPLQDPNVASGCNGGGSYMCADQTPWAVSDSLAYGFAAVNIAGGSESSWCCACYELTFTSGTVAGQKMIVQATNTGGDLGANHFDLAIPGGGFGIFNGCTAEWGTPAGGWGAQYGGISSRSQCDSFPAALKPGCYWRFDWFKNADNPAMTFKQVTCPAALTAKTGCVRNGETPTGPSSVGSSSGAGSGSGNTSKTTTAAAGVKTTTKSTASTTPSSPASAQAQAKWAQCGGINWTGGKTCVAGTTCQRINDYYFQCL